MKIKVQLSGSEKTLTIATVWSLLLTFLTLVFIGALIYKITPANIAMKIPAPNLPSGQREVMVRAVSTTGSHDVLYAAKTNAIIENGMLSAAWDPPAQYSSASYIVEVCTNAVGELSDNCFTAEQGMLKTGEGKVAGKSTATETLTSCPYYVSESRTHKLAHLLGLSSVDLQSKVYCGQSVTTSSDEFTTFSKIDVIKATDPSGMSYPDGVLIARDGALSTLSYQQLFDLLGDEDQTAPVVQPDTSGTDSQTLSLSGNILSISGGNSVDLTPAPLALSSATSTGLLSSTDWNSFAGKENSLTFDSSFVRTGDSISLMSCAANEVIKSDGVSWLCAQDIVGAPSTTYSAGTGISLVGTTFSNAGVLGVTASGALAASAGQNPAITLATSTEFTQLASQLALSTTGVSAGTYNNVTVDTKGRVTSGTNISYLTTEQDGVVGNEVAGVVTGGGLVMTGSGTSGDPYKLGLVTTCSSGQIMKWNGSAWACANDTDTDTNTDQQTLSFNPGTGDLSLVNGGTVNLSSINTDGQTLSVSGSGLLRQLTVSGGNTVGLADSDNQSLSLASNTLSLSSGGSVNLAAYLDNTDSQALSIAGNVISLTNGGSITLPADQNTTYSAGNGLSLAGTVFAINAPTCAGTTKLQWNGSAFVCASDVDTDTDAQTLSWNGGTRTLSILSGNSVVISDTDTTYSASTGITLTGTTFSLTNDFGSSIDSSEITNATIAAADLADSGATAGTYGDSGVNVTQLTVNAQGQVTAVSNRALPTANTTTTGVLSSGDWNTFNGKENVLTFADGLNRSGNNVTLMDCAASQILQRNGGDTAWVCANQVVDTNTTYSAGTGISLVGTTFSNSGVLGVTASGALASSGGQNPAITMATSGDFNQLASQLSLSTTGVGAGTYNNVTVDTRGRVTAGSNISYLTSETDGVVGNEVADVVTNGGLVMSGAGTSGSPYKVGLITTCADNQLLKYTSAGGWACANDVDTDTNTDAQTLTWNTGTNNLSVSGGNSVNLSSLLDNTDSQTLSLGSNTLSLTGGGSVSLAGYLDNTDSQTLSWNGGTRTLSLTGGGSVVISDTDTTYSAGTGITLTGTTFSLTNDFGSSIDSSEITNGTIAAADLANSGASAGTYGDAGVNVAQLTVNAQGQVTSVSNRALPTANTTTTGVLSSGDWNTFNGKENVLTFSDGLARSTNTVTLMDCAASQIIQRNAGDTAWVCANQVVDTNTTYSAGTGISLVGTTFSNSGVLSVGASGALTSSGGQNPAITLATTGDLTQLGSQLGLTTTGVSAGTYNNVTVDAQGRVTNGTNVSYLTSETDGVVGNEVADVVTNGGLVMTGAGTSGSPYKVGMITTCADNQLLKYSAAGGWACASDVDTDTNTDAQTLTWNTGTNNLSISGGNSVNLASLLDNTDSQSLSLGGNTLSLTGGGSVSLAGYLDNTDSQTLSWNGGTRTLSLTGGGSVVISDTDTTYSAGTGITLTGTTFSLTNDFGASIDSSEITNGTIAAADIANSGATAGTYGDSGVNVTQLTVNAQGQVTAVSNRALPTANSTTTGVLSSGDWNTFNGKENVLTFSDGLTRSSDTITLMDCAASQILQRNGGDTAWVCANQVVDTNTTYSAGTGLSLVGTTFSNTGVLSVGASGALTSSGGQNPAITLATTGDLTQLGSQLGLSDSGVTAGTYNNVTVDAKGRVTSGSTISYLTAESDGVIGNEVADVVLNGGLVMTGAGTSVSPYKVGLITTCSDNQLLKYTSGGGWACANDIDTNTDTQTLTWNTGTNSLSISGGNSVSLSSLLDNTDSQTLGLAGNTLSLTNGGSVDLSGYLDNTDSQSLSWNGGTRTLSLTSGGSVVISDQDTTYSAGTGITLTGTTFSLTNDFGSSIDSSEIANGTITATDLANSGATAGTYGDSGVSVAQLTVNAQGQVTAVSNRALPSANTTTTGVLSSSDWNTFNGKENVLTFSDGLARTADTVTLMDCAASQIIQRDGGDTAWVCANQVTDTNTTYSAGTGLSLVGTTFSNSGVLSVGASGALTSSGGQNPAITLATTSDLTQLGSQLGLSDSGVTAGTYNNVTVDAKGRVTSGSTISYLTAETDGVIGNEVADVVVNGGLVMTGAGTGVSPYKVGLITTCSDNQLLKYTSGGGWACANDVDTDTNTDAQTLTWNTGTNSLSISGGNSVSLSSLLDNTDSQTLGLAGNTLSLTNGGSVDLSGYLDNTDSQSLSWNGGTRTLSLTNGGSVVISDADTTYSAGTGITLTGTTFSLTNDFGASIDSGEITDGTVATADLAAPSASNNATYGDTGVNVANITVNDKGQVVSISNRALPTANTTTSGILSSSDWNTFNGKENVLTFNDGLSRATNTVSLMDCAASEILQRNAGDTAWTCATQVVDTNTTYSAGTGITLTGTTFSLTNDFGSSIDSSEITNGTIAAADIANSGATAGTYGDSGVNVTQLTVNAQGQVTAVSNRALPTANSTTTGVLSSGDWNTFNGKENVLTFTGNGLFSRSGDTITGIAGTVGGQVLKWNGSAWVAGTDNDTTYTNGNGLSLSTGTFSINSPTCAGTTKLQWNGSAFVCSADVDTDTDTTNFNIRANAAASTNIAAGNTISFVDGTGTNASRSTNDVSFSLTNVGTAGTYGSATAVPVITTDAQGRVTAVTSTPINFPAEVDGVIGNEVTDASANGGLTRSGSGTGGSPYTLGLLTTCSDQQVLKYTLGTTTWGCANDTDTNTTYTNGTGLSLVGTTFSLTNDFGSSIDSSEITNGTIAAADLANSGATAGTYGDTGVNVTQLTVNAQGQVTAVSNRALPTANTTTTGVLSSGDWNTFNGKENVLTFDDGLSRATNTVSLMDCAASEILQRNAGDTAWACATQVVDTNTTYSAGTGITLTGTTFSLTNDFGASIDSSEITNATIAAADLANSGATAGTYGDTGVNVAQLTVNAQGQVTAVSNRALPTANTTTSGILSSGDWNTFNGKENVLTFTGNGLFSRTGNTITGLAGTVSGQVIKWNGSAWVAGTDNDTTYTNGNGLSLSTGTFSINSPTCAGTTKLQWNGSAFVCSADVDTDTDTTNFNIRANAGASANIASGNTISFVDGTGTSASRSTNDVSFSLTNVGTAGTYGSATQVPVITTDAQGRITGVTNTAINFPAEVDGVIGNEVTAATANGGLTRAGSGTGGSPYTLGLLTTCTDQQVLKYTLGTTTWGCANDTDTNTTYTNGTGLSLVGTTFSLTNDFGSSIDSSEITNATIAAADLANSGATAGTYGDSGVNVAQLTVNAQGQVTSVSNRALPTANTTTTGILSSGDWNTFNGKENVLTFTGNGLFSRTGNTITGLAGTVSGQVIKWNGSAWVAGTDNDTTYTNGNGLSLSTGTFSVNSPTCAGTTKLQWNGSAFSCAADVDTDTDTTNFNIRANAGASANIASGNTVSFVDGTGTSASRSSNDISFSLTNVGTAGTYGSATSVPVITTDAQGRITGVTDTPISFPAEVDGVIGNEVTNATANGGLTRSGGGTGGSPYTLGLLTTCSDQQVLKYTLGTTTWGCANDVDTNTTYTNGTGLSLVGTTFSLTNDFGSSIDSSEITNATIAAADLANSGATAGTYGDSGVSIAQLTVNAQGQVTSVSNRALPTANTTTTGILSSGDWNTFNGKENVLTFTGNGLFSRSTNTVTGLAGTVSGQVIKWNGSAWATGTDNDTTYTNGTGLSLAGTTFSLTNDFGASIDSSEITNATIAAADVSTDAFNFTEFSDSLAVDAATTITLGANNLTTNVNSTGAYAVQANGNTVLQVLNTGAVSIGNILSDQTIGVDNGTGTINIATDSDANTTNIGTGTGADTVNIGDANANVAITDANWSVTGAGAANFASISGAGLTSCNTQNSKLLWNSSTSQFSCGTDRASVSVRKSANETVASSAALQDDDELLFAANTNETWIYEVSYIYTTGASATPDIRVGMNGPAGSTCVYQASDIAHAGNASAGATACNTSIRMTTTATGTKGGVLTGSIATAATAGNVAFRWAQNTSNATGTVVVEGSSMFAFKLTGADYAETYYTNDSSLAKGQLVELDGTGRSQVKKATQPYSDRVLGIVSTQPGQVVGEADGQGRPVQVALMGRVPIKLSTENGLPKAGDMITSSSTLPGYGMKATRSGNVFGQLLVDATDNGDGTADGFVFVRNGYWQAPVSIDLAKIFGTQAMTNLGTANDAGISVLGLSSDMAATYSGFDQAVVDEILRGFTLQQDQIKSLENRVTTLEQGGKEVPWLDMVSVLDSGALNFSGNVNFAGSASFENPITHSSNTAGTTRLPAGQLQQVVNFATPHSKQPKVIMSPNSFIQGSWRVSDVTPGGFVIQLSQAQTEDVEFTWQAVITQ